MQDVQSSSDIPSTGINWRYTSMKVRIGPFDALIVFPPLMFFAMKIAWWTFTVAAVVIISMWMIEIFLRMPLKIVYRSLRSKLAGSIRYVVPWWKKNKL